MIQLNLAILYDPFYDRIIFANKVFFHRTMGDIPSVEFDLQVARAYICIFVRLKSAYYKLFTNFIVWLYCILSSKDWEKV